MCGSCVIEFVPFSKFILKMRRKSLLLELKNAQNNVKHVEKASRNDVVSKFGISEMKRVSGKIVWCG